MNIRHTFFKLKGYLGSYELTEKDLISKEKNKFEIFKYFDDWYLFIRGKVDSANAQCCYYTNRDFSAGMKSSGYIQQTQHGNGCWQFSPTFFQGGVGSLYYQLFEVIYQNSIMCNRALIDNASSQKISINPTYKKAKAYYNGGGQPLSLSDAEREITAFLQHHYLMLVGQEHVNVLEKTVADQVGQYFSNDADSGAIFHALVFETWQWFRELGKVDVWDQDQIRGKLTKFHERYTCLPQQIGKSLLQLQHVLGEAVDNVDRTDTRKALVEFIEQCNSSVSVRGISGSGKSHLIADWLLNHADFKQGEYLYFASPDQFAECNSRLISLDFLKLIVIDGIKQVDDKLVAQVTINGGSKKYVFISEHALTAVRQYPVPVLSQHEIKHYLHAIKKEGDVIIVGEKPLRLGTIVDLAQGGLYQQMQKPAQLLKLARLAQACPLQAHSVAMTSTYLANSAKDFEPIPLNAKQVVPLYTFDEVCSLSDFSGSKCLDCGSATNIQQLQYGIVQEEDRYCFDIAEITLSDDPSISYDIQALLKQKLPDSLHKKFDQGKLLVVLTDSSNKLNQWPALLVNSLYSLPFIITLLADRLDNEARHKFRFQAEEQNHFFSYECPHPVQLPDTGHQKRTELAKSLPEIVVEGNSIERTIIVADGGAGKSTTLKMIHRAYCHANNNFGSGKYQYVIYVPFDKLVKTSAKTLIDVMIWILFKEQAIDKELWHDVFASDLANGKVLFLLDAWDEINRQERHQIASLLTCFREYSHILVSTRPSDQQNLFFKPWVVYELQTFTLDQVRECFVRFFKQDAYPEKSEKFVEQATLLIQRSETQLAVIGLPLQCYLLCEAWQLDSERFCNDEDVVLPWKSRQSLLCGTELYQLFVVSRLRKLLKAEYGIERAAFEQSSLILLSMGYVQSLQNAAYQSLLRDKTLSFDSDPLGEHLARLGLIEQGSFAQKTYAEYFLALYLVNLLIKNESEASHIIAHYRYQVHFQQVFEFMAAIASYGDVFIPQAKQLLGKFWCALLQAPRDCIGIIDDKIVSACCLQSDTNALKDIFDSDLVAALIEKNKRGTLATSSETQSEMDVDSEVEDKPAPDHEMTICFKKPERVYDYWQFASNISQLPVKKYDATEKEKAFAWLLKTLQTTGSFRVKEACVEKLSELGMVTKELLTCLQTLLTQSERDQRSDVHRTVVERLVKFDEQLLFDGLNEEQINVMMGALLKGCSTRSGAVWVASQNFPNACFDVLLDKLAGVNFSTQFLLLRQLVEAKGITVLTQFSHKLTANSLLNIGYLYVKVLKDAASLSDFFNAINSLKIDDINFDIFIELLIPIQKLIKDKGNESHLKEWGAKLFTISLFYFQRAQNELKHKKKYKNHIHNYVAALVKMKIDPNSMNQLLEILLSENMDNNYWGVDAVLPCLKHLMGYYCPTITNYIIYRMTQASFTENLSQLLNIENMSALPDDSARREVVKTCLRISIANPKLLSCDGNDNPAYCIRELSPSLVIKTIIQEWDDNYIDFIFTFLKINHYALTIHENSTLQVYLSSGIHRFSVSHEIAEKIKQNLPKPEIMLAPITDAQNGDELRRARSPSPVDMMLGLSTLYSSKIKRPKTLEQAEFPQPEPYPERQRVANPAAVVDTSFSIARNLTAKLRNFISNL